MPQTLLKPVEAARRLGISRSYLFDMVSKGELPQPVKLSARKTGFIEAEIDAFIETLAAKRGETTE